MMKHKFFKWIISTLLVLIVSPNAFAGIMTVTSKAEFLAAVAAERSADGCDTILVKYVDGGISIGSIRSDPGFTCEKGKLVILGESSENGEKPILMIDWQFGDNEVADNFSLIIENMHLQYRSGAAATSGQIFYAKRKTVHFKEFILRDCEISNYARTIIRTVPTDADAETGEIKYGSFEHFEISDCKIHYANISSGNTWACIVMGSPMTKCVLKDNLFYDLPYNKQIFSMSYINKDWADIENSEVIIENNAFFTATQVTNPLFQFDDAIGQMSSYSICNNIFMRPNWTDDYNLEAPIEVKAELDENGDTISSWTEPKQGQIFSCSDGIHSIKNNIVCDYYRESAGPDGWAKDVKLDADGKGAWLFLDSVNANINPVAAGFSWSDLTAPEAKEFYVCNGHPLYTMGTNGAPIGPKMMLLNKIYAIAENEGDSYLYTNLNETKDLAITEGNYSVQVSHDVMLSSISYTRNFKNTAWQAWYVPFETPYSALSDDFEVAYLNDVHQWDDDEDGAVDRMEVEAFRVKSGVLRANYPYLVRAKVAGEKTISIENAVLKKTAEKSVDCTSIYNQYTFTGIYTRRSASDLAGCYALSGGTWKLLAEGTVLNPFRIYLKIDARTNDAPMKIKSIPLRIVGETTDIENVIKHEDGKHSPIIYDLNGRRVKEPSRGLYLIDGKKVYFK